jgi:cytochrome P450
VQVCTYLMQRHPGHWDRPDEFVPSRWAARPNAPAYLPFGYGTHACVGAGIAMDLLEDLVRILTREWHLTVTPIGAEPHVGPALAPPEFRVELRTRVDERR